MIKNRIIIFLLSSIMLSSCASSGRVDNLEYMQNRHGQWLEQTQLAIASSEIKRLELEKQLLNLESRGYENSQEAAVLRQQISMIYKDTHALKSRLGHVESTLSEHDKRIRRNQEEIEELKKKREEMLRNHDSSWQLFEQQREERLRELQNQQLQIKKAAPYE